MQSPNSLIDCTSSEGVTIKTIIAQRYNCYLIWVRMKKKTNIVKNDINETETVDGESVAHNMLKEFGLAPGYRYLEGD